MLAHKVLIVSIAWHVEDVGRPEPCPRRQETAGFAWCSLMRAHSVCCPMMVMLESGGHQGTKSS